jgi:hypothetical protein
MRFLAAQVGVDTALIAQYAWEGRTIEAHRAQIREMTKMREFRRADTPMKQPCCKLRNADGGICTSMLLRLLYRTVVTDSSSPGE